MIDRPDFHPCTRTRGWSEPDGHLDSDQARDIAAQALLAVIEPRHRIADAFAPVASCPECAARAFVELAKASHGAAQRAGVRVEYERGVRA